MLKVSIDPGISATGIAVFCNGAVIDTKTFWPPRKGSLNSRLERLVDRIVEYLTTLETKLGCEVRQFAVEEFGKHAQHPTWKLMSLAETTGYLIAALECRFPITEETLRPNKGKAPKKEAALVAMAVGIEGTSHEHDAIHLGMLAGFYGS